MAYKVIIAEKPSVAGSIAKIVGATTPRKDKANGYMEGNGYRVTWAFGHLVGLCSPEEMGTPKGQLPIFPESWKTKIIETPNKEMTGTIKKQMKTIESLFFGADEIIVATDAGREGELIFRYIYEYLGCRTPFKRLWISSLTDEAIRNGMSSLLPGGEYDSLSDAAHARSEADYLVGFNASRALRIFTGYKGSLSLGRVQTPVLCMICDRYAANKNFVPTPFWQIEAESEKDSVIFPISSELKYTTEQAAREAEAIAKNSNTFRVTSVDTKDVVSRPPLLYDITSLQRAANSKYGMTAEQTLSVAQKLYEKKFLSYPRTGSRYIPKDVFRVIPSLISKVEKCEREGFATMAAKMKGKKLCSKSVNDEKVTDHHALLPTDNIPTNLSGDEKKIWEMVCGRMLEAFGEDSVSKRKSVDLTAGGIKFKTSGSTLVYAGWKAVFGTSEPDAGITDSTDDEGYNGALPDIKEGDILPIKQMETVRKTDKPLPIYTDSSLLGEMETCGKKIEDEELRESMKDVGLGTPATRAATIETLIARGYAIRESKKIIPTDLGNAVWKIVSGRKIADVKTTGEWERELSFIERGQKDKYTFDSAIKDYVLQIIEDLRANCKPFEDIGDGAEPVRMCPCCGKPMKNLKFSISCDADAGGCGFGIRRTIGEKNIPVSAINALSEGKVTGLIKGFTSKSGKKFDAKLRVNKEEKKIEFFFDDKPKDKMEGRTCPCCGKQLQDNGWKLTCDCGLELNKTICKVPLKEEQIDTLLGGGKIYVKNMIGKSGKKFNATVYLNKSTKKTEFIFDKKQ